MDYKFLTTLFLIIALAINLQPVRDSFIVKGVKTSTIVILYPLQKVFKISSNILGIGGEFVFKAYYYQGYSKKLEDEVSKLKGENTLLNSLKLENEELRSVLNFRKRSGYRFSLIPAQVIGRDFKSWNSIIEIDYGQKNGAKAGLNVISKDGLVGKIIEVGPLTSKVELIISPQSSVSSMTRHKNVFGIARGGIGTDKLRMDYVAESAELSMEAQVIVSSASGSFIQGIPVGKIIAIDKNFDNVFQRITLKTATDFSSLKTVFICK